MLAWILNLDFAASAAEAAAIVHAANGTTFVLFIKRK